MTSAGQSSNLQDLRERMRNEWDRRIAHDYRYWMSDGVSSDQEMWTVGQRDFSLLLEGYPRENAAQQTVLEIGCGVGRLLRAAASFFQNAIGIDVSQQAITEATRLLDDLPHVKVILGNGVDLQPLADGSIDFAYSFAALSSMPVPVIARYLFEISRVLRPNASARLQVYLGHEQDTAVEDTIAIRSFDGQRFAEAVRGCGFVLESSRELVLPFEISDREAGLVATIVSLRKVSAPTVSIETVETLLAQAPERAADKTWTGSETEYLMALARARQHIEQRNFREADKAVRFAAKYYSGSKEKLEQIVAELEDARRPRAQGECSRRPIAEGMRVGAPLGEPNFVSEHFRRNWEVLARRFPTVAQKLLSLQQTQPLLATHAGSSGDPVIVVNGLSLDQKDRPRRGGEVWAERLLAAPETAKTSTFVMFGFAGGYHIPPILKAQKAVFVCEPRADVLLTSLAARDLREVLEGIAGLHLGEEDLEEFLGQIQKLSPEIVCHPQTKVLSENLLNRARGFLIAERGLSQLRPSLAVVGPLYGGSLPIAGYTARALVTLQQRVRNFDLSSYYASYKSMDDFVRDRQRIGHIQSQYVEMLSQLVLESIDEHPVDIVISLAQAPLSVRVLSELRKRGIITVMWFVEDCRRFTTWKVLAPYYDYMFLIQKDEFLPLIEKAGAGRALYLPVGCDPAIHCPMSLTTEDRQRWGSQLSFVGAGYNNRQQVFAGLGSRDFKIWGTEWPTATPFDRLVQEKGRRIDPSDYVKIFNASAINLNLHSSSERDGVEPFGDFVNPRTFELAASGAFQLVDQRRYLPELFDVQSEMATFSDRRDLDAKIDHFLAHPEERQRFSQAARDRALRDHTYEKRLQQMLGAIYADRYEELKARENESGWEPVLERSKKTPELHQRFSKLYESGEPPTLQGLVKEIRTGQGNLSETEQRLLFLHHVKEQVYNASRTRQG